MTDSDLSSPAFRSATLRSERARVLALIAVSASLLVLVLVRGAFSLVHGHRGEAWPFAVLLAAMMAYEVAWLRYVTRTLNSGKDVPRRLWVANILIESLLPTAAIFLQVFTPSIGPDRALTSPAVLAWFVFIILSTLHLDPHLARLAGLFSAAGYAADALFVLLVFPEVAQNQTFVVYSTLISYTAFLFLAGFAAAAVAGQIRFYVLEALREVETRTRIERDLGIARSIQQGLLPQTAPEVEGFDISGWNKPADETGGDYFDWQKLANGHLAVTIADVTGHGIGSALCMAACRAYARAGFSAQLDLGNVMCRMNQLLHHDLPTEKFVTLAAGLLDPVEATLKLLSAGHGPLLFYSFGENSFHAWQAQGIPLGLIPRASYGSATGAHFPARRHLRHGHGWFCRMGQQHR